MSLVSSRSESESRMRRLLPEDPLQSNEQSTAPVQNVALLLENSSDDSMLTRVLPTVRVPQRKFCLLGNIRLSLMLGFHSLQRQILQTWGTFFTVGIYCCLIESKLVGHVAQVMQSKS